MDDWFVDPVLASAQENPTRFSVLAPDERSGGLAAVYETKMNANNVIPFDERAMEERLSQRQMHELMNALLNP